MSGRLLKRTLLLALALATLSSPVARAAGEPVVTATWVEAVSSSGANLRAEIDPAGSSTTYYFEYVSEGSFLSSGFAGAAQAPPGGTGIGSGSPNQHVGGLQSATSYRFRVVAKNSAGTTVGVTRAFTTDEVGPVFSLPDSRGWEMVSPVDKNGGQVQGVGGVFGGGVLQAASGGGAITYSSTFSFAAPLGAPGANQYISRRGSSSWTTENVTPPAVSGGYPDEPGSGVPYQLFSSDLAGAVLSNGRRCRDSSSTQCPVENPPLAGSGAPAGYRNYYLRHNADGTYDAVLTGADIAGLALGPEDFELAFAGATPDLARIVLSTCAALSADAIEVAGAEGECDLAATNLYEKSGTSLKLINLLPNQATGAPGASLAAQGRAVSADGSRVYWSDGADLYLRDGSTTKQVDADAGGGGSFETASTGGDVAYFTKSGHLWRYLAAGDSATDVTPGGGVEGVLGASDDGSAVYYLSGTGLFLYRAGSTTLVATDADPGSYPPTTGSARVSADGNHLLFLSAAELTGYDNHGFDEVYLYTAPVDAGSGSLVCASCNPSGERPIGDASLPGASPNGTGPNAPFVYKPRVLSDSAGRVFFDTFDALVPQDTNEDRDVYEWERAGSGSCAKAGGCVGLISSGRSEGGATFADASGSGDDAYFLTDGSLAPTDPGAVDVYDARAGGGFPPPPTGIPCFGDACQPLPPEPEDATPGTLRANSRTNPPVAIPIKRHCKKGQVRKKGKCVKKRHHRKRGSRR